MGYRLDITPKSEFEKYDENGVYIAPKLCLCLGKLYGYVEDETKLDSFKYLKSLGKFDDYDYILWGYGASHDIELTKEQCKTFVELYKKDYFELWKSDWANEEYMARFNQEIDDFMKKVNENVILDWG